MFNSTFREYKFDSLADLKAAFEAQPGTPSNRMQRADYLRSVEFGRTYRSDWLGPFGRNVKAATAALDGWQEGCSRILAMAEKFKDRLPPPVSVRRRIVKASQGDSLDINDVYSGRLETAWRRPQRRNVRTTREVWISINASVNVQQSGEILFWRGAAALVLADILTSAGYNVGVIGYNVANRVFTDDTGGYVDVTIKSPRDPMNPDALAGAIANPAFCRLLAFGVYWNQGRTTNTHLGFPTTREFPENYHDVAHAVIGEQSALDWIEAQLTKLNTLEVA